jgi:hypothetical protein
VPSGEAVARDAALSAAAGHGLRSADEGDPGPGREVWAVRLSAHHGAVAACGMAGGEGSSAADLATRRAKGTAEAAAARTVVARGWFVCAVATGARESGVELRFREGDDARWTSATRPGGDRQVHEGMFGVAGGAALEEFAGDRNLGGCDVGARDTRAHTFRQMDRSLLPRSCGSGWGKWGRERYTSSRGVRGRTDTVRVSTESCATNS